MVIKPLEELDDEEVLNLIQEAKEEVAVTYCIFNLMLEPELIDYAIHRMGAAENRYRYLLRWAREKGICAYKLNETQEVK
ncbi:MAG: DUF2508 family protein [Syntrophomonadaceae bacterium]|nr:DUF2508 family protein [Syntrophomonadaceae bacterium]